MLKMIPSRSILVLSLIFLLYGLNNGYADEGDIICMGRVEDTHGKAVHDASVFLHEISYEPLTFKVQRKLMQQVISDRDGNFILKSHRSKSRFQKWATVLVVKKEIGLRWATWNLQDNENLLIQLGEYENISGKVVDHTNQPVSNASVRALLRLPGVHDESNEVNYFDWLVEKTNEDGRFTFHFIPSDAIAEFFVQSQGSPGFCTANRGVLGETMQYGAGNENIVIILPDNARINNRDTISTYGTILANSRFLHIFSSPKITVPLELEEESAVDIRIQTLSGLVIEKPFIPLSDVTVSIYDVYKDQTQPFGFRIESLGQTFTDDSGNFSFERTDYRQEIDHSLIVAYKKDYSLLVKSFSFPESEIEPLTMEFGHKEYTGSVVDSDGNPISGAKVSAYVSSFIKTDSTFVRAQEKEAARTEWLTAATDENGEFIISNIPLFAKAEFSIEAKGYSKQYTWPTTLPLEEMTIPAGVKSLLFSLKKVCAIQGRLCEKNTNIGIPNEIVFIVKADSPHHMGAVWSAFSGSHVVQDLEGNNREVVTDEQGIFTADRLAPGSYKISLNPFVSDGRKWHVEAQAVDISEGQTAEVALSATQLGTVTVLVQDTKKQTLEGVNVALKSLTVKEEESAQREDRPVIYPVNSITFVPAGSSEEQVLVQAANPSGDTILPVRTDPNGVAVFCVAPGDYAIQSVRKSDYEYTPNERVITVQSGTSYDIVVNMQYLPGFYGICVDSIGQPVPRVKIRQLSFPDIISTTNEEGKFQFVRESIKRITPFETRSLKEDTLNPRNKERYRNRMIRQETIFLGMHPETKKGGWFKYNRGKNFDLEVKPTIQATGIIVDSQGNPIPSTITVYAFPGKVHWESYDYIFSERDFYFYEDIEVFEDGTFSFQLIPEFSYILEVIAEGYGRVQENIITSKYDPNITMMLRKYNRKSKNDKSFIVNKETWHSGNKTREKENVIWVLREGQGQLDFGEIRLPSQNMTLSGIVVDRMGNSLEGYRVFISGKEQLNNDANDVTDSSGHFLLSNLCEGEVEVFAQKGEYEVFQRDVRVGRDDLRIVSSDHPVSQKARETHTDNSLCDVEIVLVNQDTQERIQYERASVRVSPESGDSFPIKLDEEDKYRIRVKEGKYTVNATGYPLYDYNNDFEVNVKADIENIVTIPLKKFPIIEGIVHLPESVSADEIGVDLKPDVLLTLFEEDFKIAGDGQFSAKITLGKWKGEVASHGWLCMYTKNRKYISRTKFPVKGQWLDITLQSESIVKFKKSKRYSSFSNCEWRQKEYDNRCTQAIGKHEPNPGSYASQYLRDFFVEDDEYFGVRGLIAGQDDLSYIFNVDIMREPIIVQSKDLEAGQTKIIEIPSP